MRIAIDIDGTITEHPEFFAALTKALKNEHEIHIITGRRQIERMDTEALLKKLGIEYHHLHIIGPQKSHLEEEPMWRRKGEFCEKYQIDILFEDMDRFITHIPARTLVFKVRNGANFCFDAKQWHKEVH